MVYISKLYLRYLEEKNNNSDLLYLFRSGMFYIFIDEDAKKVSEITTLNLGKLNDNICKCGFPVNSLEKYLTLFKNLNLDIKIIETVTDGNINSDVRDKNISKVIKKIKVVDVNNITPLKALNILKEVRDLLDE